MRTVQGERPGATQSLDICVYTAAFAISPMLIRCQNLFTRLRQMTGHVFMAQEIMEKVYDVDDVDGLCEPMDDEDPEEAPCLDMIENMRQMIEHKFDSPPPRRNAREDDQQNDSDLSIPLRFRRYLRELAKNDWQAVTRSILCEKCGLPAEEPYATSCMHLYCKECLREMMHEAAKQDHDSAQCIACRAIFSGSDSCENITEYCRELRTFHLSQVGQMETNNQVHHRGAADNFKWIDKDGRLVQSSKTKAAETQLEQWLNEDSTTKIIIFSQFRVILSLFQKVCERREWRHCTYHGGLTANVRDDHLSKFKDDPNIRVLIASMKWGGVGLNLTEASKVIDLWFNTCIEQQAFCRVFRMGQVKETYLTRFVVKDTIDEGLLEMQKEKDKEISQVMDERTAFSKLTINDMMKLLGTFNFTDAENAAKDTTSGPISDSDNQSDLVSDPWA